MQTIKVDEAIMNHEEDDDETATTKKSSAAYRPAVKKTTAYPAIPAAKLDLV